MKTWLKKIIVVLPVLVIGLLYLRQAYGENYSGTSFKRVAGFMLSITLLYLWIIYLTIRKKQDDFLGGLIQSSFFVYLFVVLQLTGYFILFKEISSHGWWDKMHHRVQTHDHVNLTPFKTMGIYNLKQWVYITLLISKWRAIL